MIETVEDRFTAKARLTATWERTDRIFEILAKDAWLAQPIALRHPFIFYLGHLPAFAWNHVCVGVLEHSPFNAGLRRAVLARHRSRCRRSRALPRSSGGSRSLAVIG